uniref:Electron transfer flavoprotein alpha/beta-subunit N-terminal domain-containing protein n=1 Tax=Fervidobacterium thailandense TaxID=1008305 RepID=A0A7C5RIM9_9BACT
MLELALIFKDSFGAKVKVAKMEPPASEEILLEAYAVGAHECYLLMDSVFSRVSTWMTSFIIPKAERIIGFDLITLRTSRNRRRYSTSRNGNSRESWYSDRSLHA